ncbi:MAG: hypothetical protein GY841_12160 [FCB group bacterium]|nr:hypothetical protein [FCB group bacterium]
MKKTNKLLVSLLLVMIFSGAVVAQVPSRNIAVVVDEVDQEIPDFTLADKLHQTLATDVGMAIMIPERDSTFPSPADFRYDVQRLFEWGRESGCRYILLLQIEDRRIATRKRTSIPFVLNRYVVEGRLKGVYRLLDLNRDKVVGSWKLQTRLNGPQQNQLGENYPGDPDLHLSAMGKMTLLDRLDRKAADEIMINIKSFVRGK